MVQGAYELGYGEQSRGWRGGVGESGESGTTYGQDAEFWAGDELVGDG